MTKPITGTSEDASPKLEARDADGARNFGETARQNKPPQMSGTLPADHANTASERSRAALRGMTAEQKVALIQELRKTKAERGRKAVEFQPPPLPGDGGLAASPLNEQEEMGKPSSSHARNRESSIETDDPETLLLQKRFEEIAIFRQSLRSSPELDIVSLQNRMEDLFGFKQKIDDLIGTDASKSREELGDPEMDALLDRFDKLSEFNLKRRLEALKDWMPPSYVPATLSDPLAFRELGAMAETSEEWTSDDGRLSSTPDPETEALQVRLDALKAPPLARDVEDPSDEVPKASVPIT